jgi:hypothetical protein
MGRPPLSIDIAPKEQRELAKLLSGGVQQVRVVLRALALLQLARGVSAPQIANVVRLTSQAIRNIGRRYQQGGLERALDEKQRPGAAEAGRKRRQFWQLVALDPGASRTACSEITPQGCNWLSSMCRDVSTAFFHQPVMGMLRSFL